MKTATRSASSSKSSIPAKSLRKSLLGLALSGLAVAVSGCADLGVGVRIRPGVEIRVAGPPPGPRLEHIRAEGPSRRHVWVEGFWDWNPRRRDWEWVPGGWVLPPRGRYRWVPPHYQQRGDGWVVIRGHWN